MFSLIPKTDAGLWLGPMSSVRQLPFYLFSRYFLSFRFEAAASAVANYYYALERVTIVRRRADYLLSPALSSPRHITRREHGPLTGRCHQGAVFIKTNQALSNGFSLCRLETKEVPFYFLF